MEVNTPMPDRMAYAIFRNTDYSLGEVRNLSNEQLEAIDWKRISESRGVGEITRKLIYNWLTERGIKAAKNIIQLDTFKIDASKREDDVKLRLRILELKVEYDKAMTCNYLNLEACYRFVKYGINEDYQSIQL
ncbi:hypothetical protein [uncultured Parabacteroides sp.]|uniref:hypothetical protein n=1 Tax=uncultured Parabacteroides sp. TaxID=512312 RepID=UPI00261A00B1|nr:hypothetical protein [uncultured Parabacteroides sp.]